MPPRIRISDDEFSAIPRIQISDSAFSAIDTNRPELTNRVSFDVPYSEMEAPPAIQGMLATNALQDEAERLKAENVREAGVKGAEFASMMLAPELLPAKLFAEGGVIGTPGLVGNIARATAPALASNFSALGIREAAEKTGIIEDKPFSENLGETATNTVIQAGIPLAFNAGVTAKESLLGRGKATQDWEAAQRPGITAAMHGAPSGKTDKELGIVQELMDSEGNLLTKRPFDVDTAPPNDAAAYGKYQQNLTRMAERGTATKNDIITRASEIEAGKNQNLTTQALTEGSPLNPELLNGVKYQNLTVERSTPTIPKTANGVVLQEEAVLKNVHIDDIFNEMQAVAADIDEAQGIEAIKQLAKENFLQQASPLSETTTTIKQIDNKIRSLKGYDPAQSAAIGLTPSKVNGELKALKVLRKAIQNAEEGYIGELLGEDAKNLAVQANRDISTALDYTPVSERFEIGALAKEIPGSTGAMKREVIGASLGPIKLGMGGSEGGAVSTAERAISLNKTVESVERLKAIADWRLGTKPAPISRQWIIARNSPEAQQQMAFFAFQLGILPTPDAWMTLSDKEKKDIHAALIPQLPTGIVAPPISGFKSEVDGKLNALDTSVHMKDSLDKGYDPEEEALIIGGALDGGKYVQFQSTPTPIAPSFDISPQSFSSALGEDSQASTASTDTQRMIQQMNESRNNTDYVRSGL